MFRKYRDSVCGDFETDIEEAYVLIRIASFVEVIFEFAKLCLEELSNRIRLWQRHERKTNSVVLREYWAHWSKIRPRQNPATCM